MKPLTFLLAIAALALGACGGPAKQWYKPESYTVADFKRDQTACTTDGTLDEACLRGRGWIPLSVTTDEEKGPTPVAPAGMGTPGSGTRRGGY